MRNWWRDKSFFKYRLFGGLFAAEEAGGITLNKRSISGIMFFSITIVVALTVVPVKKTTKPQTI
jgi:hypothetical protein